MCLASCTLYLLVWLEKNYPGRYSQKDLLIRIIASPAVITLLGEGGKNSSCTDMKENYCGKKSLLNLGRVTWQFRNNLKPITPQIERLFKRGKKMLFSIFSGGNIPMRSPWGETVRCSARTRISYRLKVESWRRNYITPRVVLQWLRNPLPCRRICNELIRDVVHQLFTERHVGIKCSNTNKSARKKNRVYCDGIGEAIWLPPWKEFPNIGCRLWGFTSAARTASRSGPRRAAAVF